MHVAPTALPGVLMIEPQVIEDERGHFFESYNAREFAAKTGIDATFVQDNHTRSVKNVLRGLHYQVVQPQGKLARVIAGEVFDVVVDIRKSSPTFGQWNSTTLSAENKRALWIPPGFAHGYLVLSEFSDFIYKTTAYWEGTYDRCIAWDDPALNIRWPLLGTPILSGRDRQGTAFADAEVLP